MAIFSGADERYKPVEQRIDTRHTSVKIAESLREYDGGNYLNIGMLAGTIASFTMPVLPVVASVLTRVLSYVFLNQHEKLQDFPYRMPKTIEGYDGSEETPDQPFHIKKFKERYRPKGGTYYGRDRKTDMQLWASNNDDTTHSNIYGTTGSGKTELIHTIITAQLAANSGALIVDAKGDIALYERFCALARRFNRDADVLVINFSIGKGDRNAPSATKKTNSFNLMLNTTAGMLIELLSGLLDGDGGSDDMWKSRAIAYIGAITQPLVFLRDKQEIELAPSTYLDYMELPEIERFVYDNKYNYEGFEEVIKPLRSYLTTLPGYNLNLKGNQAQQTNEQFGYITMQMTRSINDLGFTYGHIFNTAVGEIDISDVVLNRRLLAIQLPSLERSLPSILMLARLIMGSVKQMMASSLGSEVEGSIRININSRPTTALNCYRIIFDEVGYMMTTGMSILPAQARSLNMSMVFAAQDYTDIERGSAEEAQAIWSNAALKFVGKLSSGEESEMWRRTRGIAGDMEQTVVYQYERKTGVFNASYRAGGQVQKERRSRVVYEEMASQKDGQFTLLASKKYQGGRSGGIAVVPFLCLFTGTVKSMGVTYVNDFVPMSTTSIQPPDISKKYAKIKEDLLNDNLSASINKSITTDTHNIDGGQTATNSLNRMMLDIQNACLVQKDSDNFVNILLESSLNTLALAMQGIDSNVSHEPKNTNLTAEDRASFFAEGSIESEITYGLEQLSNNEFDRIPEVQKGHYKNEHQNSIPEDIAKDVEAIHRTGRAVDLEQDTHIQDKIKNYTEGDDLSFFGSFDEMEGQKEALCQNLIQYAQQFTAAKADTAQAILLRDACRNFSYVPGKPMSEEKERMMMKKLAIGLKK